MFRLSMVSKTFLFLVAILAIAYELLLRNLLFTFIGIGRVVQPVEDFEYECRRIRHPLLESCEDLWLDQVGRTLYAACSDMKSRSEWVPSYVDTLPSKSKTRAN